MNAENVPCGAQRNDENFPAAETPRTLWIELTSKCPYDCVFCSRKLRRGAGAHLPFAVYRELVESLAAPRRLVLNYSGESTVYPGLIPAIDLARGRGAFVELVSAFSSIAPEMVAPLARSGLGRLTVSVHAASEAQYRDIYRHGSFAQLEARLAEFLAASAAAPHAPAVDFAFVAMDRNLDQLAPVAAFAARMGVGEVMVWPVLRRDDIAESFSSELEPGGAARADFLDRVSAAAAGAGRASAGVKLLLSRPLEASALGEAPLPCPKPLPPAACIHGCEQNPWETAHVLSNGDVVVCEALDKIPMGNLFDRPMAEIWHGEAYREFRRGYPHGAAPECRACPWKRAYLPAPLRPEILAREGASAQLLYGWHENRGEDVVWSTQESAAVLRRRAGSRALHVSGILPPGPGGDANELAISCNGAEIGRVRNPWEELMPFGLDFAAPAAGRLNISFRARHVLRPSERGMGADHRDLGFALVLLASQRKVDTWLAERQARELERLRRLVERVDRAGAALRRRLPLSFGMPRAPSFRSGISVVIPERDNPGELAECLESLERAAARLGEPVETVVAVNGTAPSAYDALRRRFPCRWLFHARPLGFAGAVRLGLRAARFDWVYLLNNDMRLDPGALAALLPLRAPGVFSIGSQIFFKDPTRFREETNCTALRIEDGLAAVHDVIPPPGVSESFYSGGGASLFQRRALARLAAASDAYNPFYWEDAEWGWRARKMGYRVLFCAESVAHHRHRATIGRLYEPDEVETTIERNRLLFQLRNLTAAGSLDRLFEAISRLPRPAMRHFLERRVMAGCMRVRLWNHLAARGDGDIWA